MSQAKVDRYKAEKAHRKENLAKLKRRRKVQKILTWIVLAVAVVSIAGYMIGTGIGGDIEAPAAEETEIAVETESAAESDGTAEAANAAGETENAGENDAGEE